MEILHLTFEGIDPLRGIVFGIYFLALALLALYALHRLYLVFIHWRFRSRAARPARKFKQLPLLTVQVPIFNEQAVCERVIQAVCQLDYPKERLEIQILDDSTDETSEIIHVTVQHWQTKGYDISHLHRPIRTGFKAGALAHGLKIAKGTLIAVFDADFVPSPDFANRLIHYFTDDQIGMVQARWGHLNAAHSALTRVQSILLDGHFAIEHPSRNVSGRFFNFNGTAGIWRKQCIFDAGGWAHDTLTEDLDISYRAQMKGWKFVYVLDHVSPGELPVELSAFKSQQHRWAKGSTQTARKILPTLLGSTLPLKVKLEALTHLTEYFAYVFMVILVLLLVPSMWLRTQDTSWMILHLDLPIFFISFFSKYAFYLAAHREAVGTWRGIARWMPFVMAIGIGLSINNCRGVIEALVGHHSDFIRTPKYNLLPGEGTRRRHYRIPFTWDIYIEFVLALYFLLAIFFAIYFQLWLALPILLIFLVSFAYTSITTLSELVGN